MEAGELDAEDACERANKVVNLDDTGDPGDNPVVKDGEYAYLLFPVLRSEAVDDEGYVLPRELPVSAPLDSKP